MSVTLKVGMTLRMCLECDPEEWVALYPWDSAKAQARQGDDAFDLSVSANPSTREIWITGDTAAWLSGRTGANWKARRFEVDLNIIRGGELISLPPNETWSITIVGGATQG